EGATVIGHQNIGGQTVLAFQHNFIAVVEDGARVLQGASDNHARSGGAAQQGSQSDGVTWADVALHGQLVSGDARDIVAFEVGGANDLAAVRLVGALVDLVHAPHDRAAA